MNRATHYGTADCPLFKSDFRISAQAESVELVLVYREKYAICETCGLCVS